MKEHEIIPFLEPIFRFCIRRVGNRYDAEDLAGEIVCYALEGMKKYEIASPEAWIWRIAHNRYARYIDGKNRRCEVTLTADPAELEDDWCLIDEETVRDEYGDVFRILHTLSSGYRNIFVDYYLGGMPVKDLSAKYSLPESTIKWRLNVGREKIRKRIGENQMDKVYRRINWNTTACNGSMDADAYLHTQLARAICLAAYEKPLTVEEISLATGIPTLYIEDELPRLEYGDAVKKTGNRYGTDFIIFSLENRARLEGAFAPKVQAAADALEAVLAAIAPAVRDIGFYGCDFGMERLGYIAVPYLLRGRIRHLKNQVLDMPNGPFPPRKDGGYGWFIVSETEDESEEGSDYSAGCNSCGNMHYYTIGKYFAWEVYCRGMRWFSSEGIIPKCVNGRISDGLIDEDHLAMLMDMNLVVKAKDGCRLNFACFTKEQFDAFTLLLHPENDALDTILSELITMIRKGFGEFVPKRLESQINQWVSCYTHHFIGYVTEELIARGVLERPSADVPMVNGIFYEEQGVNV